METFYEVGYDINGFYYLKTFYVLQDAELFFNKLIDEGKADSIEILKYTIDDEHSSILKIDS